MANRVVVVDLLVRTGQFTAGMKAASAAMASETTNMQTKTRALQSQVGLLGVALTATAALAVVKWAQFDQAMQRSVAVSEEAAARIGDLKDAAKSDEVIKLGYDALGASDSIYELTKAGVSATDVIGGALTGALSLAAVEAMDAGEAAQIMASALNQFGLTGTDSAHVADLLAAGAAKAQGSAHELGFALKQSGLVANQFGMSIEETTGTLAFFASAGLIGSDAGTSLRTMLLHLAGPSTKAANLMKEIGLEVYGANGEMVDMETLANNLQSSMGELSETQRNQALATIFGADATRAASLLYREGGDRVAEWTDKVDDAGFATMAAADMMDTLNGDVKKLSATWDRSMINMGESADGPMRNLVQQVTGLVDGFGDLNPAIQGVILALVGGGGLAILGVLALGQITSALSTLKAGMVATGIVSEATANKMTRVFGKTTKALTGVGVVVATLAVVKGAILAFADSSRKLAEVRNELVGLGQGIESLAGPISDAINSDRSFDELIRDLDLAGEARDRLSENWWNVGVLINDGVGVATQGMDDAYQGLQQLDEALGEFATVDLGTAQDQFTALAKAMGATDPEDFQALLNMMPEYKLALLDAASAAGINLEENDLLSLAMGNLTLVTDEATGVTSALSNEQAELAAAEVAAQKAHEEYISAIVDSFTSFLTLGDVYQGVIDAQKDWATSAAESTESTTDSWEDFYDGQTVSAGQYIAELQKQVEAQEAWAANMSALTSRVKDEMPADLQAAAQEMIAELRALGPEGAAQVALLESMSAPELQKVVELYRRQGAATGQAWAEEIDALENPKVGVDTTEATSYLSLLQNDANALNAPTITVGVKTDEALAKINAVKAALGSLPASATVTEKLRAAGAAYRTHATGGAIVGAGTGTSDSIPALLSNGEHVLTADDVQKAGGQTGVYRMRSAIQAGMLRFASGGAVGGQSLDYWNSARLDTGEILDLQIRIRDLRNSLAAGGADALTGLDRSKASYDLGENERKLREGLYANSLDASQSIASRLAEQDAADNREKQKAKYSTDISRGEFKEGLAGGMSGAYNSLDRLRNDVLPNLVGPQQTALADAIKAAEENAKSLYTALDDVDLKLKSATEQAEDLQSISGRVQSGLSGGFDLGGSGGVVAAVNPFTGAVTGGGAGSQGKSMLGAAQAYATKIKTFATKLQRLADRGFAGAILQELAALGAEAGIPAADALLSLDPSDTSALNRAYEDINTFSAQAGQAVSAGFYEGGLAAADGIVAGLQDRRGAIQDAIMQMAMDMQTGLKAALGIASPARKIRDLMKFVGQGAVLGLEDQQGIVTDASARLFAGVTVPGGSSRYGAGGSVSGGAGDLTASLSDAQVERLAVAFETGNVRNINAATAQQNQKVLTTYGARGR